MLRWSSTNNIVQLGSVDSGTKLTRIDPGYRDTHKPPAEGCCFPCHQAEEGGLSGLTQGSAEAPDGY